jgi:acyl-CoA thioesterase FadM
MSKQRIVVYDDQILIDMEVIFGAIREAKGDWQKVEQEMRDYFEALRSVVPDED